MLRLVLGVCGGGLIAFGVFGGQALESMHRGLSGIFTPDTTVVENTTESVLPEAQPAVETVVASVEEVTPAVQLETSDSTDDDNLIVLASSEGQPSQVLEAVSDEALVEVKAASQDVVAAEAVQTVETVQAVAVVVEESPVSAADTLVKVSKEVEKSPLLPIPEDLKAEGVEVVLNATAGGPPSDTLFVLKERVNMREGPSTEHAIVLQLDIGQELMQFKRDGKWVHVGAYGTSGKIGWVHETLVGEK